NSCLVRSVMTYSTFLCLMDRVRSLSCAPILPLHPSHTPPLCCNAGRNATSSPPARAAPSREGTETRLDTTAKRNYVALRLRHRGAVINYPVGPGSVFALPPRFPVRTPLRSA